MEKSIKDMVLLGYFHFSSKDKKEIFYIVQVLYNDFDAVHVNNKATMINIYITDEEYKKICQMTTGTVIKVEIIPNFETGKIYYKVVI